MTPAIILSPEDGSHPCLLLPCPVMLEGREWGIEPFQHGRASGEQLGMSENPNREKVLVFHLKGGQTSLPKEVSLVHGRNMLLRCSMKTSAVRQTLISLTHCSDSCFNSNWFRLHREQSSCICQICCQGEGDWSPTDFPGQAPAPELHLTHQSQDRLGVPTAPAHSETQAEPGYSSLSLPLPSSSEQQHRGNHLSASTSSQTPTKANCCIGMSCVGKLQQKQSDSKADSLYLKCNHSTL